MAKPTDVPGLEAGSPRDAIEWEIGISIRIYKLFVFTLKCQRSGKRSRRLSASSRYRLSKSTGSLTLTGQ